MTQRGAEEDDDNERSVDQPPFRDKRDIVTAINALADTALKLAEYNKATGNEDEKSMHTDLRQGCEAPGRTAVDQNLWIDRSPRLPRRASRTLIGKGGTSGRPGEFVAEWQPGHTPFGQQTSFGHR